MQYRWVAALCLALQACDSDSGQQSSNQGSAPATHASILSSPASEPVDDRPRAAAPSAVTAPMSALAWLPANTLFALRLPSLAQSGVAWQQTALYSALGELPLDSVAARVGPLWSHFIDATCNEVPGGESLLRVLGGLGGEVVIAVPSIQPLAMAMGHAMPFTVVCFVEVGDHRDELEGLLAQFAELGDGRALEEHTYRFRDPGSQVDVGLRGDYLCLCVGPPGAEGSPATIDAFCRADPKDSFLHTELCERGRTEVSGTHWLECFVHLRPAWALLDTLGATSISMVVDELGLRNVDGWTAVSSLDGEVVRDRVAMHTASSENILSEILSSATLDPEFVRLVPQGADLVHAQALDFRSVREVLRQRLPAPHAAVVDAALATEDEELGSTPGELIEALGSQLFVALRGALPLGHPDSAAPASDFEATFALQWRDVEMGAAVMERIAANLGGEVQDGVHPASGFRCRFVELPEGRVPFPLQPAWTFLGDTLVVATSPQALSRSFHAHVTGQYSGPPALLEMLESEQSQTWLIQHQSTPARVATAAAALGAVTEQVHQTTELLASGANLPVPTAFQMLGSLPPLSPADFESFAARLPDANARAYCNERGVAFESTSPWGSSWFGVGATAVVASIAIPNLLSARLSANESAAIATMRNLCSAQAQAQASAASRCRPRRCRRVHVDCRALRRNSASPWRRTTRSPGAVQLVPSNRRRHRAAQRLLLPDAAHRQRRRTGHRKRERRIDRSTERRRLRDPVGGLRLAHGVRPHRTPSVLRRPVR